jgi:hypothetical protein
MGYYIKNKGWKNLLNLMEYEYMAITLIIVAGVLGVIGIVFPSINKWIKTDSEIEKLKLQKEILELETKKQDSQIKLLEAENQKYDKIINMEP